jgi:hypothetical protein
VVVSATLIAVILAACLIPAHRALQLDLRSVITSEYRTGNARLHPTNEMGANEMGTLTNRM